ncbi:MULTISPECIES: TetR/AcrR family transcriptional regulator [Gordonia]|uniref:Putative TetR family transcriptional regulator n=1 Tax=Gordonia sihwensis NBRC 108236 TaxID=1223544 RepID=L7LKW3_9ACTN|nr:MULTISPECIES: TetR/AcrR family transcriptional regulator [Gordonia]AUH67868.1 TetR/AcrR family transcriptional regulator [Gordonia sp. YC-JH1]KXT58314.1 TetR family transcriptional regulator [Gordonia sp. QH-12]GAC60683.1 putative TetR family transcriptional regulator [Gordonia sihwensis NBRC 108236]
MSESPSALDPLRSRFLDAGLRVLARDGYGGFKQSTVCAETGLTTGGFYHSFKSWRDFETALIEHWKTEATANVVAQLRTIGSPVDRILAVVEASRNLPHHTERALRVWSSKDPDVAAAVREVDRTRCEAVAEFVGDLIADPDEPEQIAAHSLMVLVGYQCSDAGPEEFEWAMRRIVDRTLSLPCKADQTSE